MKYSRDVIKMLRGSFILTHPIQRMSIMTFLFEIIPGSHRFCLHTVSSFNSFRFIWAVYHLNSKSMGVYS